MTEKAEKKLERVEVRLTPLAERLVKVSTARRDELAAKAEEILRAAERDHSKNVTLALKESGKDLPGGVDVRAEEKDGGLYLWWLAPAAPASAPAANTTHENKEKPQ